MYLTVLNLAVLDYPPEWKQAVRGKCLAQEHNTMLPARAQGQTAQNRTFSKQLYNSDYYNAKITIPDFEIYFRQST